MILIMNIITPRTASNEVHDLSASVRPIPGPLAEVGEISLRSADIGSGKHHAESTTIKMIKPPLMRNDSSVSENFLIHLSLPD